MKKDKKWIDPKHLNLTQKILAALGVLGFLFVIVLVMLPHGNVVASNIPSPSPTMNFTSPANTSINLIYGPGPLTELSQYNHDFVYLIKNK